MTRARLPRAVRAGFRVALLVVACVGAVLMGSFLTPRVARAQDLDAASLAELKAGLGVHNRVLMIGAHPDDEDTRLIVWLARGHRAETAYLSLTRGDGGQNLIGNELGEALGVIRTEELLAARRIDGAHQYFSRAYDFGFSKTAAESFNHWPHDSLLEDMIRVVRAFQPQVIISVFSGTPRDGHGQHQVSGVLAREVYDLAADTVRFPRAEYGAPWTPLKFYRDAWFAPERKTIAINVGEYNENLALSYAEIAAESRSQHKSQGFGSVAPKGTMWDYLYREATRVNAETPATSEKSLFDGIDTARVVTSADSDAWALADAHIAVQAFSQRERVALGDSVPVSVSVYRRGILDSAATHTVYVYGREITQPYWLVKPRVGDLFAFASDSISDDARQKQDWLAVPVTVPGRPHPVVVHTPVIYRYADPVRGDVERPLVTAPAISITFGQTTELARAGVAFTRPFEVTLRSSVAIPCTVAVALKLPAGMQTDSSQRTVTLAAGATRTVTFFTHGTLPSGTYNVDASATTGGHTYTSGFIPIEYDHITPERMYRAARVEMHSISVVMPKNIRVGYVQGVGDNVAPVLEELGVPITMLDPEQFPVTDLSGYTTIVVGPRAYQANQALFDNRSYLLDYVKRGGNLVVQYGQAEMQKPGVMPYPVTLTNPAARVTVEDAPVTVTAPKATVLNTPNRITQDDFQGWVQERSLYMPSTFDLHYQTMLEMHDPGEPPNYSAILTTTYGKGQYTYETLSLLRQLPAANPGGVRLFANLLALHAP